MKSKLKTDREIEAESRAEAERAAANSKRADEHAKEAARAARTRQRDALRDRFIGLMQEANVQGRGYMFETFLNDLFELERLDPRRSFKNVDEQVDGSFAWRGRANLVEAKWTKAPVAGSEFNSAHFRALRQDSGPARTVRLGQLLFPGRCSGAKWLRSAEVRLPGRQSRDACVDDRRRTRPNP